MTVSEREALTSLAGSLCESLSMSALGHNQSGEEPCAYCTKRVRRAFAAVRSAVLAEVDHEMHTRLAGAFRMGAEWTGLAYLTTGPEGFYAAIEEQVQRRYPNATQPALTALEATDASP